MDITVVLNEMSDWGEINQLLGYCEKQAQHSSSNMPLYYGIELQHCFFNNLLSCLCRGSPSSFLSSTVLLLEWFPYVGQYIMNRIRFNSIIELCWNFIFYWNRSSGTIYRISSLYKLTVVIQKPYFIEHFRLAYTPRAFTL